MTESILGFSGEHRWLSNFWPCHVQFEGVSYPSVENAYQAAKFPEHMRKPFVEITPGQAKRLARSNGASMRADWEEVKRSVMWGLLVKKFEDPDLEAKLLATGDAYIEETNTWGDTHWGRCNGKGDNILGVMLMTIRDAKRSFK